MVWLINFRSPIDLWQHEPTFFLGQLVFTCCAALTLVHALRHGGRYKWLWLTTVAHGLNTECLSYWLPDIDNFWHAQGFATLFGFREPFYILLLYPTFIYPACVAVSRLRLPEHVEPFATALAVVIVDVPYDIMGIKLLWWTWHDTDPNIFERHYWVPWTSYFFHMTFACAFTFIYNHTRRRFVGLSGLYADDDIERMPFAQRRHALNWRGELKALLVTALFSMPCGIMQFTVGYHWPHDILHVPSSCCVGILAGLYLTITLYGLQRRTPLHVRDDGERELRRGYTRRGKGRWHYDEVVMAVLLHYGFYVLLVLFASPSRTVARGLHQTIGDCAPDVTTERPTGQHGMPHIRRSQPLIFLGQVGYPYSLIPFLGPYIGNVVVSKDPTLCPTSFGEDYFDFACVPDKDMMPQPGDSWYDVCGTPYENWHEYVFVVTGVCVLATCFYLHALHYPRTVLEILTAGHFPRYYKSYAPARRRGTEGMLRLRAPGKGNDGEGEGEGNGEGGVGGRTGDGVVVGTRVDRVTGTEEFLIAPRGTGRGGAREPARSWSWSWSRRSRCLRDGSGCRGKTLLWTAPAPRTVSAADCLGCPGRAVPASGFGRRRITCLHWIASPGSSEICNSSSSRRRRRLRRRLRRRRRRRKRSIS